MISDLLIEIHDESRVLSPQRAREIRESVGVSQERLAVALDVSRSTVIRWEAGETTPHGALRERYVEALIALERAGAFRRD